MKTSVGYNPLVFLKVRYLEPNPLSPSIVTLFAPFNLIIPGATAPDIVLTDADAGTILTL